jgi:hypothetical protein
LRQVRLVLAEEIDLEEIGSALGGVRSEEGGVEADETAFGEKVVDGPLQLVADTHNGPGLAVPQVEVAVLHQKIDPVLFRGDGVAPGDRDDLQARDPEFDA